MEKKFDDIANYYSMDRKKTTMEEFFGDLSMFCKDFEVRRRRETKRSRLSLRVVLFYFTHIALSLERFSSLLPISLRWWVAIGFSGDAALYPPTSIPWWVMPVPN